MWIVASTPSQPPASESHSLSLVAIVVVITLVVVVGVAILLWIVSSFVAMFTKDAGRRRAASAVSNRSHRIVHGTTRSLGSIGNTAVSGLGGGSKRRRSSGRKKSGTKRRR
jgi:flagellar basal body-associated protein FliL